MTALTTDEVGAELDAAIAEPPFFTAEPYAALIRPRPQPKAQVKAPQAPRPWPAWARRFWPLGATMAFAAVAGFAVATTLLDITDEPSPQPMKVATQPASTAAPAVAKSAPKPMRIAATIAPKPIQKPAPKPEQRLRIVVRSESPKPVSVPVQIAKAVARPTSAPRPAPARLAQATTPSPPAASPRSAGSTNIPIAAPSGASAYAYSQSSDEADPRLAAANRALAQAYAQARQAGVPQAEIRTDRQAWASERMEAAARSPQALIAAYQAHIADLRDRAAQAQDERQARNYNYPPQAYEQRGWPAASYGYGGYNGYGGYGGGYDPRY